MDGYNNIFENAYFGKLYKTRDNRKALYIVSRVFNDYYFKGTLVDVVVEGDGRGLRYLSDGHLFSINSCLCDKTSSPNNLDIISEWNEND